MSTVVCGPCAFEGRHINAKKWCTICDEGLCQECDKAHRSNKSSRTHKLILVEDYLKIADVQINQICERHHRRLDLFCKTHDALICVECVPSDHKTCSDVVALDKISNNAKQSALIEDLEQIITEALQNVKHYIADRNTATATLTKQEQEIKKTIKETKVKLIKHLDELETKLLVDLSNEYESCRLKYENISKQLTSTEKALEKFKRQTEQLKQVATDIQVFVGARQINTSLFQEINSIKTNLSTVTNYDLELQVQSNIDSSDFFGKIKLIESPVNLRFREAKIDQAQIPIREARTKTVQNMRLELKGRFTIDQNNGSSITGCIMLPDTRILVADHYGSGKLMEYNDKGQHIRDLPVSSEPYDIEAIDSDRIAVTCPVSKCVDFVNIKTNVIAKKISTGNSCWGISHHHEKLYIVVDKQGIVVMDEMRSKLNTIRCNVEAVFYLQVTKDNIYYTDYTKKTLHCCNLSGEESWVFQDDSASYSHGVSVDNNQNVFVVGRLSNTLTLIQHDGTVSKTLLTWSDGLSSPTTVFYNKERNILVLNETPRSLAFYNVI